MFWKRLAPIVLAAAVTVTVSAAASQSGPLRDCWPRAFDTLGIRAL